MSIVTVQLGQCGNQIGHEVFSALCSDIRGTHGLCSKQENESYHDSCRERFFSEEESGGTALKGFFLLSRGLVSAHRNIKWCLSWKICALWSSDLVFWHKKMVQQKSGHGQILSVLSH